MTVGHKDSNNKFHPHSGSQNGVSENDMKISVKGNNDIIKIEPKSTNNGKREYMGFKNEWRELAEIDKYFIIYNALYPKYASSPLLRKELAEKYSKIRNGDFFGIDNGVPSDEMASIMDLTKGYIEANRIPFLIKK